MDLSFKSIFSQSTSILKSNKKEVIVLTVINTYFLYLITNLSRIIEQVKDAPSAIFAFFVAITPILSALLFLLLPIIILNKESGHNISYPKMIQYTATRFIPLAITNIMYGAIVLVGYLLFIIPGLIWFYTYGQAHLFSLIDGLNPIQSLKMSKMVTKKCKRKLFNVLALIGIVYGVPLALINLVLTIFKIPEFMVLSMGIEVFGSYLFSITNYVIWKTLRQNMI